MSPDPFLGVILHAIGGLAAASFYIPCSKIKHWEWENYWIVMGLFSWIIAPFLFSLIIVPETFAILFNAPVNSLIWTFLFGVFWGVGGLTFGLTIRYLGIALGYAIALGLCAVFGTLIPPLFAGDLLSIASTSSGQVILSGILICVVGIIFSGKAGLCKEKELPADLKETSVKEFNFSKGVIVAIISGLLSSCMAYGFAAGKPISDLALTYNVNHLFQNLPVLIIILLGGFLTNFVWCFYLMIKKGTLGEYVTSVKNHKLFIIINIILCALGGVIWYFQFFFYSMGTTEMGEYEFTSWTLHMSTIIIFSTIWGLILKEWKGTSRKTKYWVAAGLFVLILSTVVVGYGNKLSMAVGY